MDLQTYLRDHLARADREDFAERCGTAWGHLRNVAYGSRPCTALLAIEIDRETGGKVTAEELCPDADWSHIRKRKRA
jgi:DNA-binding transcriptional regulator YdaS (Cro superfamily)